MEKKQHKTLTDFNKDSATYGFVGNAKALFELGPQMMTTKGIQNQLELANEIIACATLIKEECIRTLLDNKENQS